MAPLLKRSSALVATGVLALGAALLFQTTAMADDPEPPPVDYDASLTAITEPSADPLSLMATPAIENALEANFQQAVEDCVERTGFEYATPVVPETPVASPLEPDAEVGYGVVVSNSPEAIEADIAAEEEARDANLDYAESLPEEEADLYLEVIGETAPDEPLTPGAAANCQEAAAETVLVPAMEAQVQLAEQAIQLGEAVEARPDVQQAEEVWSSCMQSAGHDYATPADPEQEILSAVTEAAEPDLDTLLAQEKEVAAADAQCRDASGYTETVRQAAVEEWQAADIDMETINIAAGAIQ
jgi:hypothetical protein